MKPEFCNKRRIVSLDVSNQTVINEGKEILSNQLKIIDLLFFSIGSKYDMKVSFETYSRFQLNRLRI